MRACCYCMTADKVVGLHLLQGISSFKVWQRGRLPAQMQFENVTNSTYRLRLCIPFVIRKMLINWLNGRDSLHLNYYYLRSAYAADPYSLIFQASSTAYVTYRTKSVEVWWQFMWHLKNVNLLSPVTEMLQRPDKLYVSSRSYLYKTPGFDCKFQCSFDTFYMLFFPFYK